MPSNQVAPMASVPRGSARKYAISEDAQERGFDGNPPRGTPSSRGASPATTARSNHNHGSRVSLPRPSVISSFDEEQQLALHMKQMEQEYKRQNPGVTFNHHDGEDRRLVNTDTTKTHDYDLRHMEETYATTLVDTSVDGMLSDFEVKLQKSYGGGVSKIFIVDPKSTLMMFWDCFMLVLIIINCLVTPYDVTFNALDYGMFFIGNHVVDGFFFLDFLISFNLMYRDKKRGWITNHRQVAYHYIRGWFTVDFISLIPYDILQLEVFPLFCGATLVSRLRVLRLLKMLRICRTPRILTRLESKVAIDYSLLTMIQFIAVTILTSHWLGCIWGLIPEIELAERSWHETIAGDGWSVTPGRRYAESLYFAVYSITSTGYGDVVPQTQVEMYFAIIIMSGGTNTPQPLTLKCPR